MAGMSAPRPLLGPNRTKRKGSRTRRGRSPAGMEYATWGDGPRTLLFIPGGPPSTIPTGWWARWTERQFSPYVAAGFTVWLVTRRRGMPIGHTMADIAADHAEFIREEQGGHVDLVVGESLGGLVAQFLAADHPGVLDRLVLVVSGYRVSDWTRDVDSRLATAVSNGHRRAAGAVFAEYALPGTRWAWLRRILAGAFARMVFPRTVPPSDVQVEADAERTSDTSAALPRIEAPVLLIAGDKDRFFPREIVEETARLIKRARIIWHPGKGHLAVAASGQVTREVLDFVRATRPDRGVPGGVGSPTVP